MVRVRFCKKLEAWVDQNYLRDDTITAANTMLVAAPSRSVLAGLWGGSEVASADGMRVVVPVRSVHSGPNPRYFGVERGVTWYKLISNQFSGLNDITVPGTLRDSHRTANPRIVDKTMSSICILTIEQRQCQCHQKFIFSINNTFGMRWRCMLRRCRKIVEKSGRRVRACNVSVA